MRSLPLKGKHDRRQLLERGLMDALLTVVLTDGVVLAVHAPEVTIAEEDIANTVLPAQRGLLAEMQCPRRDHRKVSGVAPGLLVGDTVDPAHKRAYSAPAEHPIESIRAAVEFTGSVQGDI